MNLKGDIEIVDKVLMKRTKYSAKGPKKEQFAMLTFNSVLDEGAGLDVTLKIKIPAESLKKFNNAVSLGELQKRIEITLRPSAQTVLDDDTSEEIGTEEDSI